MKHFVVVLREYFFDWEDIGTYSYVIGIVDNSNPFVKYYIRDTTNEKAVEEEKPDFKIKTSKIYFI